MTTAAGTHERQIQVRIFRRHGRDKAQYRSRLASGEWSSKWFHMSVADARRALRTGEAHVGFVPSCEVVEA